jgi:hypothetical protein
MANLSAVMKQLHAERDRVRKQLSGLEAAIRAFGSVYIGTTKPRHKRRNLTARARAKMAAAQKARWAAWRAKRDKKVVPITGKRTMSASARRRIAAAQRARWAKVRAKTNAK